MNGCTNCLDLAKEAAATHAIVERLEKTLLGNGQPGRCQMHEDAIGDLTRWRSGVMGALRSIQIVLGIFVTVATAVGGIVLSKVWKG